MSRQFICEPIEPEAGSMDAGAMAGGGPGFPKRFTWRGAQYVLDAVVRQWRETSGCRHGSGEQYVRKHWFEIRTTDGASMKVYFERQPRSKKDHRVRWWLHTLIEPGEDPPER